MFPKDWVVPAEASCGEKWELHGKPGELRPIFRLFGTDKTARQTSYERPGNRTNNLLSGRSSGGFQLQGKPVMFEGTIKLLTEDREQ